MKRSMTKQAALLLVLAGISTGTQATSPVPNDLILDDVTDCKKPPLAPPPLMKENYERYNIQRRYIDLDGSGTCVLMEVWVERLGNSDSPGMRTLRNRFLRVVGKKWASFQTDLQLFPFLLRSPSTGETYLVDAPDADIDRIVGAGVIPEAFVRGSWQADDPTSLSHVHKFTLLPVGEGRSQIFRTLAAQLVRRTPSHKQTPAERERIRSLQFRSAEADKGPSPTPAP